MFLLSLFLIICTFFHRIFVIVFKLIPADTSYYRAYFSGFFSDLSLVFLLIFLFFLVWTFLQGHKLFEKTFQTLCLLLSAATLLLYTTHLRYVEHFEMTLRPFHLFNINTMPWKTTGSLMILESTLCCSYFICCLALSCLCFKFLNKKNIFKRLKQKPFVFLAVCLFCFIVSNVTWIQLRKKVTKNHEFKSSLVASFYHSLQENTKLPTLESFNQLQKNSLITRDLLEGQRSYLSDQYPLWQKKIAQSQIPSKEKKLFKKLKDFIKTEEKKHGPWNIIVVMSESLRAFELESFGLNDPTHKGLTPQLTKLSNNYGIRFTEVIAPSRGTRMGQPAVFCSLYTFFDESIMNLNPNAHVKCLGSIFKEHHYKTSFFYSSSNNFDNAATFYTKNNVDLIHGEEEIDPSEEKGGWGFSDHALFRHVSQTLEKISKPFFSLVLTLTNHSPYVIPKDIPEGIIKTHLPLNSHQIVQYVDWSFGEFFNRIKKNHPHSLVLLTADEGKVDTKLSKPPTYQQIRRSFRVPVLLLSPKMPSYLAGESSDSFGSLVDVAPTLLHFLGWDDTEQQFMGTSLFYTKDKIYTYLNNQTYLLEKKPNTVHIKKAKSSYTKSLLGLSTLNLLSPSPQERKLL